MNRTLVSRYWPFLAIAALWLTLVAVSENDTAVQTAAPGFGNTGMAATPGAVVPGQAVGTQASQGTSVDTATAAASSVGQSGVTGGPTPSASESSGSPQTTVASTGGGQPVDALGRPLDGDRSKCAEGGLLQEDISLQSPPCMPRYEGDNGGATYQGVTADEIKVVIFYEKYDAAVQQVLAANELAMTESQTQELHGIYEEFFNSHYEFYGRTVKMEYYYGSATNAIEYRAEAKAVVQKHKPFAVIYYAQGLMPLSLADQISREGVIAMGVTPVGDDFYIDRAPFVYSQVTQGYRVSDLAADYYCKKMKGKNATLAGDPAMKIKKRKIGVGSTEDPNMVAMRQRFIDQITGGMCGSPSDTDVQLYIYPSDPDAAEAQTPALTRRLKDDGITTTYGLPGCAEFDKQQYFPENFRAEVFDDDYVGRVFAALCGPTQMEQVFGIGFFPQNRPRKEKEFHVAAASVNPSYAPPYLAEGPFQGMITMSRMIQYAGPILTPQNIYNGTRSMPQIAGWENPNPWPGWTCCNPYTPTYHMGIDANGFTAKIDARQIYWSNTERSEGDGATGAWVGVDNGRRYGVGQWPKGEPRQP